MARQGFTCIAGGEDLHRPVADALGERPVEGYRLVPEFAGVLVDSSKQRRGVRQAQIGLIERDLRRIDGFGRHDAALGDIAPVLRIGRLAFPERRHGHSAGSCDDHPVDMPLDPVPGCGKSELLAAPVAGPEIKACLAEPLYRQVLEHVPRGENAERLSGELPARIAWEFQVLILQPSGADIPETASAQIIALWTQPVLGSQRGVNRSVDFISKRLQFLAVIEVQLRRHQKGIPADCSTLRVTSKKPPTATSTIVRA